MLPFTCLFPTVKHLLYQADREYEKAVNYPDWLIGIWF